MAQVTGSFVVAGAQLVTLDSEGLIKVLAIPVFFLAGIIKTVFAVIVSRRGPASLAVYAGAGKHPADCFSDLWPARRAVHDSEHAE